MALAGVRVINCQGTTRGQRAVFHHRACGDAADHRHLVAAGDGDGDVLGGEAAVIVGNLDLIGLDDGLVVGQEVDRVIGDGEVPGHRAADAVDGVGDGDGGERAELAAAGVGRGDKGRNCGVAVGEVDIGEGHRAGGGQIAAGDVGVLGHTPLSCSHQDSALVAVCVGDGDVLGGEAAVIVGNLDLIDLGDGLVLGFFV